MAGHDIDYIAIAGALEPLGRAGQPPTPPLNVIGDFGGAGCCSRSGSSPRCSSASAGRRPGDRRGDDRRRRVDADAVLLGRARSGFWGPRGTNLLDTGAPFYEVYETADGEWMAVGAIEPQFYAAFVAGLGLDLGTLADRDEPANWPALKTAFATVFPNAARSGATSSTAPTHGCGR